MSENNLHVRLSDNLADRLEKVHNKKGLSKSEIARRGLLEELEDLEGDSIE